MQTSDHADDARIHLAKLLLRIGDEDRAAFDELYRLTATKLFGITLRICGDRSAAEDVLNEVYVIVWRRAGAWEPGRASPITWLCTIARNRAIDWRRAHKRFEVRPLDDASAVIDPAPSAEELLSKADERRTLLACLAELEVRRREAIGRAFFDGATYADLAARTEVPLGTMKSRIRRGLMQIRECMRHAA